MTPKLLLTSGHTQALQYAYHRLLQQNFPFTTTPSQAVTHLLLPVPSFGPDGTIKGGAELDILLAQLPKDITIIGGNLDHPLLKSYNKIDLLKDAYYLAMNARITAHCALSLATQKLSCILDDTSILVIGWGRIGKCLTQLLKAFATDITVATRNAKDRATLASLGINAIPLNEIIPAKYGLIYNTAPEMILPHCNGDALKIDLASKPGIDGDDVIWSRGLPNKMAPKSSGKLIAETVATYLTEKEVIT